MRTTLTLTLAVVAVLAGGGVAQVGDPLPEYELEGFTQTGASSLEDFSGRLLLIEFFAYW